MPSEDKNFLKTLKFLYLFICIIKNFYTEILAEFKQKPKPIFIIIENKTTGKNLLTIREHLLFCDIILNRNACVSWMIYCDVLDLLNDLHNSSVPQTPSSDPLALKEFSSLRPFVG